MIHQSDPDLLLRAALIYARRGWPVFPCCWPVAGACGCGRGHKERDIGKAPLTPHGFKDATRDPDIIRRWWSRWPLANVAIAAGFAGLVVVDVDDPDALYDLAAEGRELPDTATVTTGRGLHYYYAGRTRSGDLVPGAVEVKSIGGYVMAPPSLHKDGRIYTWETTVRETPLVPVPDWVRQVIEEKAKGADGQANPPGWAADFLRTPMKPGGRRGPDGLPKIVGYFRAHGIPCEVTIEIVTLWDAQNPQPLGRDEVEKHVRGMYERYGIEERRQFVFDRSKPSAPQAFEYRRGKVVAR